MGFGGLKPQPRSTQLYIKIRKRLEMRRSMPTTVECVYFGGEGSESTDRGSSQKGHGLPVRWPYPRRNHHLQRPQTKKRHVRKFFTLATEVAWKRFEARKPPPSLSPPSPQPPTPAPVRQPRRCFPSLEPIRRKRMRGEETTTRASNESRPCI